MNPEPLLGEVGQLVRIVTVLLVYLAVWSSLWTGLRGAGRLWRARRRDQVAASAALLRAGGGRVLLAGCLALLAVAFVIPPLLRHLRPVGLVLALLLLSRLLAGLVGWVEARAGELAEAEPELADPRAVATRSLAMASLPPFLGWLYFGLALVQGLGAEVLRLLGREAPPALLPPPDAPPWEEQEPGRYAGPEGEEPP